MLSTSSNFVHDFFALEHQLAKELLHITYENPISHIYNPIDYGKEAHTEFLNKYCNCEKPILIVGMNPGPYGMAQTAVPFGEISTVKNDLKLIIQVEKPLYEHSLKQILGFDCKKSEVSGKRFWCLFKQVFGNVDVFLDQCCLYNICPLMFLTKTGRNIPPSLIPLQNRKHLENLCRATLINIIRLVKPKDIVAIGRYAEKQCKRIIKDEKINVYCHHIGHPSPANPSANRNWQRDSLMQLLTIQHINWPIRQFQSNE